VKKNDRIKKLTLHKETLRALRREDLAGVNGALLPVAGATGDTCRIFFTGHPCLVLDCA
jgi:hypothetical protein